MLHTQNFGYHDGSTPLEGFLPLTMRMAKRNLPSLLSMTGRGVPNSSRRKQKNWLTSVMQVLPSTCMAPVKREKPLKKNPP